MCEMSDFNDLDRRASDAWSEFQSAQAEFTKSGQRLVMCYYNLGHVLNQKKAALAHGEWLPWLAKHCPGLSVKTAQRIMLVEGFIDEGKIGQFVTLREAEAEAKANKHVAKGEPRQLPPKKPDPMTAIRKTKWGWALRGKVEVIATNEPRTVTPVEGTTFVIVFLRPS